MVSKKMVSIIDGVGEKLREQIIFAGGASAWVSVLSYFFTKSDGFFGRHYHFFWPYLYIVSLALVLLIYHLVGRDGVDHKKSVSVFFIYMFTTLSIYGVFLGVLMTLSLASLSNIPGGTHFYGGHYFFSSIIFYIGFFRIHKRFLGVFSNIVYWIFIMLGALAVFSKVAFS